MELLSSGPADEDHLSNNTPIKESQHPSTSISDFQKLEMDTTVYKQHLRRFQSQPQLSQLSRDQKRRRHFSFEPGEDQLHASREEISLAASETSLYPKKSAGAESEQSQDDAGLQFSFPTHDLDISTKIPSPVHAYGSVRCKASISSMQSVSVRAHDGRHDSQSSISQASILTAFRDNQMDSLRPGSIASSRSSSYKNQRSADISPSAKDRKKDIRVRNSVANLTTEHANHKTVPQSDSPAKRFTKPSTAGSSFRTTRNMGKPTSRENEPQDSG
jgi:hypothetical protein